MLNREDFGMKYEMMLYRIIPVLLLGMVFISSFDMMLFSKNDEVMIANDHAPEEDRVDTGTDGIEDEHLDSRDVIIPSETYIELLDEPEDVTGDGIADIGYVNGREETGICFEILLLEKNPALNEPVPVGNGTITLTITLWDDKGGRYINSTSRTTNGLGRAVFNFTGFCSNEGISIDEGLGASGKALIEFKGSTHHMESDEEKDLNYLAKPIPRYIYDPEDEFPTIVILFGIGGVIFLIIVILIGKFFI